MPVTVLVPYIWIEFFEHVVLPRLFIQGRSTLPPNLRDFYFCLLTALGFIPQLPWVVALLDRSNKAAAHVPDHASDVETGGKPPADADDDSAHRTASVKSKGRNVVVPGPEDPGKSVHDPVTAWMAASPGPDELQRPGIRK